MNYLSARETSGGPARKEIEHAGGPELISPGGRLIDDEELRSGRGRGAVRRAAVANMVALTRLQAELRAIAQRDIQRARQT